MRWNRIVEYRTYLVLDEEEYHVIARKEGNDKYFAIEINNDYVADCENIPSREYLVELINEQLEIERKMSVGMFRRAHV